MSAVAGRHVAVIGGGISGLAAAHRLIASSPTGAIRVTLLEASERCGGWVRTEPFAGRAVDFGPDSLLVRTPWAAELCRELRIDDELVAPGGGKAYLWTRGELRELPRGILAGLPDGPMPFVRSGLLSRWGVVRAALDLVLPRNAPAGDESIGSLVRRRLGDEVLERVVDPLLGGVHAGNCDDLSVEATAPQIAAAARARRSLIRGLRATAPKPPVGEGAPAPVFMAPKQGMIRLVDALLEAIGGIADVRFGAPVTAIEPVPFGAATTAAGVASSLPGELEPSDRVRIHVQGMAAPLDVDAVILAVPAAPAAQLLARAAPHAAQTLSELRYASVAHVALSYAPEAVPELPPGSGFLVPRAESTLMTACTFLDQKWPGRLEPLEFGGPLQGDGTVVIKCSTGRIDDDRHTALTDEQLVAALHGELATMIGLTATPLQSHVMRVPGGLPQYAPGHPARIDDAVAEVAAALPGVVLTGAAYRGTSVPLCIREGRAAADAVLARFPSA